VLRPGLARLRRGPAQARDEPPDQPPAARREEADPGPGDPAPGAEAVEGRFEPERGEFTPSRKVAHRLVFVVAHLAPVPTHGHPGLVVERPEPRERRPQPR